MNQRHVHLMTEAVRQGWPAVRRCCPACGSPVWPVLEDGCKVWSCGPCSTAGLLYPDDDSNDDADYYEATFNYEHPL